MLVPQEVPRKRGWIASIYSTPEEIAEQENLLDSLEAALVTLSTDNGAKEQKLFDVELDLVTDQKILDRIGRLYRETRRTMHASHSLDMERAYEVRVGHMSQRFKKCKVANVMELWHGTRPGNLLSILKSGLIIPAQASHGRAFGNGVYFSDQSTKALNYASGWWAGRKEANAFMFLADVKMGKPFVPQRRGLWVGQLPKPGFDSTFAEANRSGVLNNEMIVYDTSQVNLKYLVEFK